MNIYLFELKAQMKSFLIWTVSIVFIYIVFMTGLYPVFSDSLDYVLEVAKGFPPEFAAAFGLNIAQMFSYSGFFSFVFGYIALVGAIMAVSLSVSTFSREKRSKCTDFLLTKPIKRETIFAAKLLANLTMLIAANIIFVAIGLALYSSADQESAQLGSFTIAVFSLLFTQIVFLAIGMFFAAYAKKVRSVSGIATAFGFAGFILSALYGILEEEAIRFIAPLKYFDPGAVLSDGGYEVKYAVTAVVVIIICTVLSYVKYCRSDAHAV